MKQRNFKPHESVSGHSPSIENPDELPIGFIVGNIIGTDDGRIRDNYVFDPGLDHPDASAWFVKAPVGDGWRWKPISPGRYVQDDSDPFHAWYRRDG